VAASLRYSRKKSGWLSRRGHGIPRSKDARLQNTSIAISGPIAGNQSGSKANPYSSQKNLRPAYYPFAISHVSMSVEGLLAETESAPMTEASSEPPDEVLVVAAIVGDLQAFDQLVLRYRAAVVRVATGIVGREHAEDVAQDAWLLAFKALPSIEEPRKFAAWLSAITRHRAMRFGESESNLRSRRVALDEVLIEKLEAVSPPLADRIEDRELLKDVNFFITKN
jgi:hypothetical protein